MSAWQKVENIEAGQVSGGGRRADLLVHVGEQIVLAKRLQKGTDVGAIVRQDWRAS